MTGKTDQADRAFSAQHGSAAYQKTQKRKVDIGRTDEWCPAGIRPVSGRPAADFADSISFVSPADASATPAAR